MPCPNCGGHMHGDGVTEPYHCERIDRPDVEPDANPVYCESVFSTVLTLYDNHITRFREKPTRLYIGEQAWYELTSQAVAKPYIDPRVVHRSYMGMRVIETLDLNHIGVGE